VLKLDIDILRSFGLSILKKHKRVLDCHKKIVVAVRLSIPKKPRKGN
jgi:hypothetical protein